MVGRGSDGDPAPAVPRSGAVDPVAAAAPTPTLDVEVVDRERGTPIAGASVVVACGERAALSLLTDASGHAASDAVPPGDCQISVSAPGYLQGGPITGAPRPVRVSADETARVRLEASATVTVAGKLIGGTGPAEEVELAVGHVRHRALEARAAGHFAGELEDLQRIKGSSTRVPVRDGSLLVDVLQEWAIRRLDAELPGYFSNARVVVVGGTTRDRTIRVLREFTDNIVFDDPHHDLSLIHISEPTRPY